MRNLKMLAVCGAMVYLTVGIVELRTNAGEHSPVPVAVTIPTVIDTREEPEVLEVDETEAPCRPIDQSADFDTEDSYLLAKIAMAEAEGEDTEGKALVIMVILNRVCSSEFPDSIEKVILQKQNGVHQFSVTQSGGRWWTVEPNEDCYEALEMITAGKWDESQGAMYFESQGKSTWHKRNLEYLFQHGNHYFYKNKEK